jgi:hypothetical protein
MEALNSLPRQRKTTGYGFSAAHPRAIDCDNAVVLHPILKFE